MEIPPCDSINSAASIRSASFAPLACSECRRRHVKCDGQQPVCARCLGSRADCAYVPSRRGQRASGVRAPTRKHGDVMASEHNNRRPDAVDQSAGLSTLASSVPHGRHPPHPDTNGVSSVGSESLNTEYNNLMNSLSPTVTAAALAPDCATEGTASRGDTNEHLVDLYYSHFHPVHPLLSSKAERGWLQWPKYLQLVVQLVGSHYCRSPLADSLRCDVDASMSGNIGRGHYEVQALLLYAMVLHGRGEHLAAQTPFSQAVQMARDLKMDDSSYARENAPQSVSLAETFRRTWWELVIVDTAMAAFCRRARFIGDFTPCSVLLPVEEFRNGEANTDAGRRHTFAEFASRIFMVEEHRFLSSAYRIEAACVLGEVVDLIQGPETDPDTIQSVDNCLAAWCHHLPPTKMQIISASGEIDHLLFQAHLLIHCGVILLHLPRSHLVSQCPVFMGEVDCAQPDRDKVPSSSAHVHAVNAIAASRAISDMAALRVSPQQHSPLFICALALAATVQLAAISAHRGKCIEQHQRRISLILGLLQSLGRYFDVATRVLKQIKPLAAALLSTHGALGGSNVHVDRHDSTDTRITAVDDSWLDGLFESFTGGGPCDGISLIHEQT